ncbi:MAG TPA: hypothetical protein VFZ89_00695, partial [Solirubrobacteraceae bacterium]
AEGNLDPGTHCTQTLLSSTSCGNRFHDNKLGQVPPGFTWPTEIGKFGNPHGPSGAAALPNGVDFWWDEFAGNNGNCWYDNTGPDGTTDTVTGPGAGVPPDVLPFSCRSSVGLGDVVKEAILLDCSMWSRSAPTARHPLCYWFTAPPRPGTRAARREQREFARTVERYKLTIDAEFLRSRLDALSHGTAFTTRHG